jgi:type II restriction/modification system DNA methylase subunit YeeA
MAVDKPQRLPQPQITADGLYSDPPKSAFGLLDGNPNFKIVKTEKRGIDSDYNVWIRDANDQVDWYILTETEYRALTKTGL